MKVVNMPIDQVIPYDNNPRDNEDAVEPTANSIKEFGFQQPIVVDKDHVIIVGHTRLQAARFLQLSEVPVVIADGLSKKQADAYRLADNKTGDLSVWENKKLLEELDKLGDEDIFTGFTMSDVFDDVLDESDNTVLDDNDEGVTYSLNFKTQDKNMFDKILDYIDEVSMVNG